MTKLKPFWITGFTLKSFILQHWRCSQQTIVKFVDSNFAIDLSSVDKQTTLIGMDGWMLVKHPIVLTDVSTKLYIFGKLSIKLSTSHDWLLYKFNTVVIVYTGNPTTVVFFCCTTNKVNEALFQRTRLFLWYWLGCFGHPMLVRLRLWFVV